MLEDVMKEYVFGLAVRVLLTNDEGKILIIKRSTNSKTNPGKWELPGGKVDQGESFDKALIREVYEETNLNISLDHVVGVSQQNLPFIRAVHIIMSGEILDGDLQLSSEHEGFAWEYLENLSDYELADWLEDYVNREIGSEDKEINDPEDNILKPVWKSFKTSVDRMWEKNRD